MTVYNFAPANLSPHHTSAIICIQTILVVAMASSSAEDFDFNAELLRYAACNDDMSLEFIKWKHKLFVTDIKTEGMLRNGLQVPVRIARKSRCSLVAPVSRNTTIHRLP
jgi:hypothetical protein